MTSTQKDSDPGLSPSSGEAEARHAADAQPDLTSGADGELPVANGDSGYDFDDFEEGTQDDDFDDFDDGFQQATPVASEAKLASPPRPTVLPFVRASLTVVLAAGLLTHPQPIPDFDGLESDEVLSRTEPYLDALFPPEELDCPTLPPLPKDMSIFNTPRAAPLWSQLVAPPPLAPPDWIRSRTRRLFLVSLGVPVDLDEILPASKQKKLILPSLSIPAASPRTSGDGRSASRPRQDDGNASSTSLDTQGRPAASKGRRRGSPRPELDLVAARYLCTTTDEALHGMTMEELRAHVAKLESMQDMAQQLLEYWQKRTDEKIGDREAFEGVIENLVKHARKVRK